MCAPMPLRRRARPGTMRSLSPAARYPFVPRSRAHLRAGQFWALPLSDGRYGCGRVLAVPEPGADDLLPVNQRVFLAALMDWVGEAPPDADAIAGSSVLDNGLAHVKTIQVTGGEILGCRELALDNTRGILKVSHRAGGTVYLYEGAERVRAATTAEAFALPILGTWGYRVIAVRAEAAFVAT